MADLRAALLAADYTYDAVADRLGATAHAALGRNETSPGLLATGSGDELDTLVRLFLLQVEVDADAAEAALPGLVDRLSVEGILRRSQASVAAAVDVRPYAADDDDLWLLADLTPGMDGGPQGVGPDHVLGLSPAATSLAQMTVRTPVARALDLGTGCGVQALHLATHADHVVATDVNERALRMTRWNAELNERPVDVRAGSYFEPVAGERYDVIATNPPFVISPATGERLVYRDSGLPGDEVVAHIVREAPAHLTDGGLAQVLANWIVPTGGDWQGRLSQWIRDAAEPCDAWVVQREVVDLPTYVELWLKDAGQHPATGGDLEDYRRRYTTWLSWLQDNDVEAVGFGWIFLRRRDGEPHLRLEEWPYDVVLPVGDEVVAHFEQVDRLRELDDAALAAEHLVQRPGMLQETSGNPGAEDPGDIVLRQQTGLRRARKVSTAQAAFVGACDGDLTVGQLVAAITELVGPTDLDTLEVRSLVEEGFVEVRGA